MLPRKCVGTLPQVLKMMTGEFSVLCFFFFLIFSLFHAFPKTFFNFLPSLDFDLDQGYTDENRKNFTSLLSTFFHYVLWLC